jgi:hypothetical protein
MLSMACGSYRLFVYVAIIWAEAERCQRRGNKGNRAIGQSKMIPQHVRLSAPPLVIPGGI